MGYTCGYQLVTIGADGEPTFDGSGDPIPTGPIVTLGIPRWGREIVRPHRENVELVTKMGRRWIYPLSELDSFRLTFRTTPDGPTLSTFSTLDTAVGGNRDPFLFCEDVNASPRTFIFVRKDVDFNEGQEQPLKGGVRSVDYVLTLTEEPTGTDVTA